MGFQETHLDVLQNIEFAVVSVYRDHSTLLDYSVMNALDALIEIYRAESRGHTLREISLTQMRGQSCNHQKSGGKSAALTNASKCEVCVWLKGDR